MSGQGFLYELILSLANVTEKKYFKKGRQQKCRDRDFLSLLIISRVEIALF